MSTLMRADWRVLRLREKKPVKLGPTLLLMKTRCRSGTASTTFSAHVTAASVLLEPPRSIGAYVTTKTLSSRDSIELEEINSTSQLRPPAGREKRVTAIESGEIPVTDCSADVTSETDERRVRLADVALFRLLTK